ncbi:MAG TPA: hypothetical protein VFQ45_18180 [Longimicrobium sp.]|nr:hypothetical protein [Longimicrobium sp.]
MTPPAVAPSPTPVVRGGAPAPPPLPPNRAPFSRTPHRDRTPLLGRPGLAVSLALHLVLGSLLFLTPLTDLGDDDVAVAPSATGGGGEQVEYLDVGDWPAGSATSATVPAAPTATAEEAALADSVVTRVPRALPFPGAVPAGIPRAPAGGAAGGVPGAAPGTGVPGAVPGAGAGQGQGPGRGRSPLSAELGDERLVVRPEAVPERELTREERYQAQLARRLRTYNDSVADAEERRRRTRNWTIRDSQGRETGIREGGVVVVNGKPVTGENRPAIPRDREDEQREEARARREMDRQEQDVTRERHLRERQRQLRERENERRRREQEEREKGNP